MRQEYKMSDEQRDKIQKASQPVPAMFLSGGEPMFGTPRENAERAWQALGRELGFKWQTVQAVWGKTNHYFTAEPERV